MPVRSSRFSPTISLVMLFTIADVSVGVSIAVRTKHVMMRCLSINLAENAPANGHWQ